MNTLRISLVQSTVFWEDKGSNMEHYDVLLSDLEGQTDLAVLPEMFSTGFSMNCAHLAERNDGLSMNTVKSWAKKCGFAICGSFLACEGEHLYNRGFFITPDGSEYFYDKRHLFRMGDEDKRFTAGEHQLIISYKGWNIQMIICYDLRFPVWARNVDKAYDLLICPANWPQSREKTWEILLKARALENYSYVCGVNRVGVDGHRNNHIGNSLLIDFKGDIITQCPRNEGSILTGVIHKEILDQFRSKFPVWKDADKFELLEKTC